VWTTGFLNKFTKVQAWLLDEPAGAARINQGGQNEEVQLTGDEIWRQLWAAFRLPG